MMDRRNVLVVTIATVLCLAMFVAWGWRFSVQSSHDDIELQKAKVEACSHEEDVQARMLCYALMRP